MALFPFESDGLLTIDVNEPVEYIPKLLIVSRSVSCEISTSVDFKKLSIPDVFNSPPTRTESLTFVNRFSLVGGLIGVATSDKNGLASKNWCFPQKSPILPEDVIDSLSPGIYSVGAGVVNIPGSSTGVLYVDIMLSYGYKIQRFFDVKGNKMCRIYNGTSWSEWK